VRGGAIGGGARWQSRLKIKQYRSPTFSFTPLQDT
jgi:hypothetical protein